jgi:hypothetical protein
MKESDYSTVTEQPGDLVSGEALSMLYSRATAMPPESAPENECWKWHAARAWDWDIFRNMPRLSWAAITRGLC